MNVLASDHASIATAIHPDPAAQMIDIGDRRIAFASRGRGPQPSCSKPVSAPRVANG